MEIEETERSLGHDTIGGLEERKKQLRCHIVRIDHADEHVILMNVQITECIRKLFYRKSKLELSWTEKRILYSFELKQL